jgi:hypothetical protein
MSIWISRNRLAMFRALAAVTALVFAGMSSTLRAAGIDPDADQILRKMSDYLDRLKVFSVEPDVARWTAETGIVAPAEALIGRP